MNYKLQFVSIFNFFFFLLFSVFTNADSMGSDSVILKGAFKNIGEYQLRPGETLGQLIIRSGGLEAEAYPYGAVLIRKTLTEQQRKQKQTRLTEISNLDASNDETSNIDNQFLVIVKELLKASKPIGRVIVEADPSLLEVATDQDTPLLAGDVVYIPERTNTINVFGVVANPTTQKYNANLDVMDYINKSGGLLSGADEVSVRILLPNGEVVIPKISWWNYQPVNIPPGSSIIVPRDPDYFDSDFAELLVDMEVQLLIEAAQAISE
jgi:protein involved in polysaccharide export with SLBB domain